MATPVPISDNAWDGFLDWMEASGPVGKSISLNFLRRLTIEAPVVIGFCFSCVAIHILNDTVWPKLSFSLGIDDHFQPFSLMQYVRLLSHVFAHDGLQHIKGNMTNLLLVGPSSEHVFGSFNLMIIMIAVALSSAVTHVWFGKQWTRQLGASGICFALILLNSLVGARAGKIPLSFLLTAGLWISEEIWRLLLAQDGVSHHAHLTGALVGMAAGYEIHSRQQQKQLRRIANAWRGGKTKP